MRMYDLIFKKRQGERLTSQEIAYVIEGYTHGDIPPYQVSALLMAIYFQGMVVEEIAELTRAMAESGDTIDLSSIQGIKVDKHSTGGVGDTTTLVLVPLVSALGIPVAKMSGRSLGHGGGTIDKIESIPGFQTGIEREVFLRQVERIGAALVGQTGNLCPADKKLYALRDVTATVDSIPLIASSIMSKKIAGGADAILLDVKKGVGAFMRSLEEAEALAEMMVGLGRELGRETMAFITNMEEPLGLAAGNALEVKEAIATLKGEGPEDLEELSLKLGAAMVLLANEARDVEEATLRLKRVIESGQGLEQLATIIEAQKGDPHVVYEEERLPSSQYRVQVKSREDGFIQSIQAYEVGTLVRDLGAGRGVFHDTIDHGVGVVLTKRVGDEVMKGESLGIIHLNHKGKEEYYQRRLEEAFVVSEEPVEREPLIYREIS